jgi:hypothetical protein
MHLIYPVFVANATKTLLKISEMDIEISILLVELTIIKIRKA